MKKFFLVCILFIAVQFLSAQNIGIGTATPATRLDVAGINGWNVAAGEGYAREDGRCENSQGARV